MRCTLVDCYHLKDNVGLIVFFSLIPISIYFENEEWEPPLPMNRNSLEEQSVEEIVRIKFEKYT